MDIREQNYTKTIEINTNAKKAFAALNEDLNQWWGETTNSEFKKDGQFSVTFENGYWWTFKIIDYVPDSKLTWQCINGEPEFNKEWIGHILYWDIKELYNKTHIHFLQYGLTHQMECYDVCSTTWDRFIVENLVNYLGNTKS